MTTPLLLIPGLMCTADLYRDQIAAIAPDREVIVADHRVAESVAAIAASILATAPHRFALAGLSMGGYLAFEILRQAPRRVERLALLDTTAAPDAPEQIMTRLERIAAAQAGRYEAIAAAMFPGFVHPARVDDAALRERFLTMARETGPDAFVRQQKAIMGRPDSRPTLATVSVPTLVLVGEQDMATPVSRAQEIAEGIRGARLIVTPDCGHLSTMERPRETCRALLQWLRLDVG